MRRRQPIHGSSLASQPVQSARRKYENAMSAQCSATAVTSRAATSPARVASRRPGRLAAAPETRTAAIGSPFGRNQP
ncbi:hypothetical protein [[Actinomadura] parvosata]|uniref:hypothetical protein n=1 Tax=[Actinomadura] parvosata TaxID=1955412 RepID=UPI0016456159